MARNGLSYLGFDTKCREMTIKEKRKKKKRKNRLLIGFAGTSLSIFFFNVIKKCKQKTIPTGAKNIGTTEF